jgi:hypothetical protein
MNMALIICLPVCIIATGFFVLFSVRMGLKWQYDIKHDIAPTEIKTPVSAIVDAAKEKKTDKLNEYSKEVIKEWFYGKDGE